MSTTENENKKNEMSENHEMDSKQPSRSTDHSLNEPQENSENLQKESEQKGDAGTDHEDAIVNESASGKATSDQKSWNKQIPTKIHTQPWKVMETLILLRKDQNRQNLKTNLFEKFQILQIMKTL